MAEQKQTESRRKADDAYIAAARALHQHEGECEIDEDARISRGDDLGAYVQAWVWVHGLYCAECDAITEHTDDDHKRICDVCGHCADEA